MTKKKLITIGDDDDDQTLFEMIRDVAGDDVADHLIQVAGGTRIYLPRVGNLTPQSELARFVGFDVAMAISRACAIGTSRQFIFVPLAKAGIAESVRGRIEELLRKDGLTRRDVSLLTGVHLRSVDRRIAAMKARGEKLGRWDASRPNNFIYAEVKGASIVRQLLLEGHSPSLLRDIMKIPPDVILTIRAELLRQGKLK
ncbi:MULTISPECIES: hypothetical protein [Rhizobium/Agrobacterium group]|uniref:Uncharacterized protein n=1 Tax=Rhizobium rhizogenes TaxID=359 RepID=A0A546WYR3_RHIRH|nr:MULTISPECIES: hypothetical protein [Rhizobium/Agrobacterium group]TRA93669.1 hypothetical protein EXN68_27175 [Rhizobium rhizogenes]